MTKNISNFKMGIFILAAVALFCTMLFFLGMSDLFVRKAHMITYFRESVQGLSVGSPVKYKGVSIGSVSDISIRVDDSIICVGVDIELKAFSSKSGVEPFKTQEEFRRYVNREIRQGLRCRLEYAGITGLRYLELDYYERPGDAPRSEVALDLNDDVYVPSEPSAFKDIAKSLNTSLERISRIRFEEISDNMIKSLDDINQFINSKELKNTLAHLTKISQNLEQTTGSISKVATEQRLEEMASTIEKTLRDLSTLAEKLATDAEQAKIAESAKSFREAADAVKSAAVSVDDRRFQATQALDKLSQTLDALRELVNTLNEDPSAIFSGRRQTPLNE